MGETPAAGHWPEDRLSDPSPCIPGAGQQFHRHCGRFDSRQCPGWGSPFQRRAGDGSSSDRRPSGQCGSGHLGGADSERDGEGKSGEPKTGPGQAPETGGSGTGSAAAHLQSPGGSAGNGPSQRCRVQCEPGSSFGRVPDERRLSFPHNGSGRPAPPALPAAADQGGKGHLRNVLRVRGLRLVRQPTTGSFPAPVPPCWLMCRRTGMR